MSKHAFTVVVAVIIAVSLLLYMFTYTVRSSDVAVVLTFGKPSPQPVAAGMHFKWPWPIQEVRTFDARMVVNEGRATETRILDGYNIVVTLFVGWEIGDCAQFNKNFGRAEDPMKQAWPNYLERVITDKALSVFGQHALKDLVSVDREPKYEDVENEIMRQANGDAMKLYGINVKLVKIKRLELPESVTKTVYERMKAERNREANDIKKQGETLAATIKSQAEAQRDQILAMARGEAERIRGEGDAAAAKYYNIFAEYPELSTYLRKIRALREATKSKSTIIVDPSMPPFDVFWQAVPDVKAKPAARPGN